MAMENSVIDYAVEAIAKLIRDVREKAAEEPIHERALTNDQPRGDREPRPLQATVAVEVGVRSSSKSGRCFAEQISDRSTELHASDHEQDLGIGH